MAATVKRTFVQETSDYGSNTLNGVVHYYLGLNPPNSDDLAFTLEFDAEYNQIIDYVNSYPTLEKGNNPIQSIPIKFTPVNALPWYWILGKYTSGTLTQFDKGTKKMRKSLFSISDTRKYEVFGNMTTSLKFTFEKGNSLVTMNDIGQDHGISTATPASYAFPSGISSPFDVMLGSECKWNGTSMGNLLRHDHEINHTGVSGYMGEDGVYVDVKDQEAIVGVGTFLISGLNADMETDKINGTLRTLVFKIQKSKDATKYMTFTISNCLIYAYKPSVSRGDVVQTSIGILFGSISIAEVDGVNASFYTIS